MLSSYNGNFDVFVAKLDASGSNLLYSTYLGGSQEEIGDEIAVDSMQNVYITGYTKSTDYPTTPSSYDTSQNGDKDIFVSKINLNYLPSPIDLHIPSPSIKRNETITITSNGIDNEDSESLVLHL